MRFRIWLSRTMFESTLIVISILLALTVAAIQEDRELEQLVSRSMVSFENEISLNKRRIDDIFPFHLGLHSVLMEVDASDGTRSVEEFRNILDSFESAVLLTSAWDTALATGALTHMEYELVSALSLTYSMQNRFLGLHSTGLAELLNVNNSSNENMSGAIYAALRYMGDITASERELQVVYQQALELIWVSAGDTGDFGGRILSNKQ